MSRISLASHPLLLGFDELDRLVERAARVGTDGFPPFNIAQHGEHRYRITLAVAGFAPEDLSVTVEEGQLKVRGRGAREEEGREFIHRGIATRQFQRSFVLAERVDVTAASLDRGLLHIELARRSEDQVVQTIPISRAAATEAGVEREED